MSDDAAGVSEVLDPGLLCLGENVDAAFHCNLRTSHDWRRDLHDEKVQTYIHGGLGSSLLAKERSSVMNHSINTLSQ